jgi:hypothetical protein
LTGKTFALDRGQPSREGAAIVFDDDADEAFNRAEDDAVEHDRLDLLALFIDIVAAEAVREVHIELNRAALPSPAHRIAELEVELRAVEGAVARVDFVGMARIFAGLGQRGFGLIPEFDRADIVFLRTGRKNDV